MISSTAFSIAPVSVTCFMPRLSTSSRGSPPSVQTISNRSLAILPEIVPSLMRSMMAPSCVGRNRRVLDALAGLVQRAEQIVDHPVGGRLAVAALGHLLEIVGDRLFRDQDRGVVGRQAERRDQPRLLVVGQFRQMLAASAST